MILKNEELAVIDGGGFTATFFNSIARLGKTIYDIGYEVGSSVRRLLGRTFYVKFKKAYAFLVQIGICLWMKIENIN